MTLENKNFDEVVLMIPHARRLGLRLLEREDDYFVVEMPFTAELEVIPGSGLMANGAITAMLDTVLGAVAYGQFETFRRIVTLDLRVDYFEKPRPFSSVITKCRCLKAMDRVIYVQGDVFCKDEQSPIAHGVAVFSSAEMEAGK